MKIIAAIVLILAATVNSVAATITLKNLSNIRVDDLASGSLESTLANYPDERANIEAAILVYLNRICDEGLDRVDVLRDISRAEEAGITVPDEIKNKVPAEKSAEAERPL